MYKEFIKMCLKWLQIALRVDFPHHFPRLLTERRPFHPIFRIGPASHLWSHLHLASEKSKLRQLSQAAPSACNLFEVVFPKGFHQLGTYLT